MSQGKLTVLHVVEGFDKGAVENWLLRTFLYSKEKEDSINWIFLCYGNSDEAKLKLLREKGATVWESPVKVSKIISFWIFLRSVVSRTKPDIVHAHHDYLSGLYMIGLLGAPIKKIVQVHNTDRDLPIRPGHKKRISFWISEFALKCCVDEIIFISNVVRDYFFEKSFVPNSYKVLYYGVQQPREIKDAKKILKSKFGVKRDEFVILFVGRLNPVKNPIKFLQILAVLKSQGIKFKGILLGEGNLKPELKRLAKILNLQKELINVGFTREVSLFYQGSDIFLFPRVKHPVEGLGLTVVEAQMNGARVLTSDGVSHEVTLPGSMIRFLDSELPNENWADHLIEMLHTTFSYNIENADLASFSLSQSLKAYLKMYNSL
ncbi:glycosyltransferase [Luteibaculum oceani]|uniref:glycosyltransferase n=1 Tax=Luteibaculum oceani TaxID=1294296 RepID=UPI001476A4BD|nr:glycosyltransferase [Luteibaculum oceani]